MVWALGLLPGLWLVAQLFIGRLGADPLKALEHGFGLHALQFLIAALAVTPLLRLAGVNLMRWRRALGLLSFTYALCHLLIWLSLDLQFRWGEIGRDLTKRPYIMIGMAAFVLLLPLAVTSSDRALRAMGPLRWRRLHLLTWPAASLAVVHFLMVGKVWEAEALIYAGLIAGLVFLRLTRRRKGAAS
ncbi:sulfoxide reductase heme-binding subunit YedZ [Falsigemmobacter faecalis]|uniref:Protein-methionine-sulfoxide reductase heme-binding subunit MsrQ n=2 Tax=Falsigemmobacter faecalis TaxID=2488730 RepID=A0A3P3DE12_9RHOB|nr:sulfoxide reductase heme-binding subunit YedZ [Falsigemmobacter faecalis]